MLEVPAPRIPPKLEYIEQSIENGMVVLRSRVVRNRQPRRVVFICPYGQAQAWRMWKEGVFPGNHLWGCLELAIMGYEVILPEPVNFRGHRDRLAFDWYPVLRVIRELDQDDIVYCAHNLLLWTPLLKMLSLVKCHAVGLLYAREPIILPRQYSAIIAHTPEAQLSAKERFPEVRVKHISWGMDLDFFVHYPYEPLWALSCGKTFRDFDVIAGAFNEIDDLDLRLLHPKPTDLPQMPTSVHVESASAFGQDVYLHLAHDYYRGASATLVTTGPDPKNRHSVGLTNVLESMVCGRPVIATRTGVLQSEIDIEACGVGKFVEPGNAHQLASVVKALAESKEDAESYGLRGRLLCEQHFNIDRYASELHDLFEEL